MDDQTYEVTYQDIMRMACGRDPEGHPNAAATLAIDRVISSEQIETVNNITLTDAVFQVYASGGCVVLQMDFPKQAEFAFSRAIQICQDWFNGAGDPGKQDLILSMVVVPMNLYGQIYAIFDNLVYFTGFDIPDGKRMLLCFDNTQTRFIEDKEIDYQEIRSMIAAEFQRRDEEMQAELEAIYRETEEAKRENTYQDAVLEQYGTLTFQGEQEQPEEESGIRFTDDNDEEG